MRRLLFCACSASGNIFFQKHSFFRLDASGRALLSWTPPAALLSSARLDAPRLPAMLQRLQRLQRPRLDACSIRNSNGRAPAAAPPRACYLFNIMCCMLYISFIYILLLNCSIIACLPIKAYQYNRQLIIGKLDACRRARICSRQARQAGRRGGSAATAAEAGRLDAWTDLHACADLHACTPGRLDAPQHAHKKQAHKKAGARLRPRRICNGYSNIIIIMVP